VSSTRASFKPRTMEPTYLRRSSSIRPINSASCLSSSSTISLADGTTSEIFSYARALFFLFLHQFYSKRYSEYLRYQKVSPDFQLVWFRILVSVLSLPQTGRLRRKLWSGLGVKWCLRLGLKK
jgi:hypothetical protein